MQKYETIFVVDSLLKSDEIDSIINKYERFISANGGHVETVERWGKKRLAYEIKKRQYGFYVLIRFQGPPTMIRTLEREYRLNESLLRFKTLAMPKAAIELLAINKTLVREEKPKEPVMTPDREVKLEAPVVNAEEIPVAPIEEMDTTPELPEETNEIVDSEEEIKKEE